MALKLFQTTPNTRNTVAGSVLKRATAIFAGLIIIGMLVGLPIYNQYEKNLRSDAAAAATQRIALVTRTIHAEFNKLVSDIKALAALPTLRTIIDTDQLRPQHPLVNYLANVLLNDQRYDQIRILDQHGKEVVRIAHRGNRTFFIPDSELRDRSDTDYVRQTLRLIPGQIYVSPMQRNSGDDVIENPNIPIIRLGTQLQDDFGRVKGLMVLDYRAQGLLDSFNAIMSDTRFERTFMYGKAGDWLYSQGDTVVSSLRDPLTTQQVQATLDMVWPRINNRDKGQVHTPQGLYIIQSVYPLMFEPGAIPNAHLSQELGVPPTLVEQYRWQLVTFIPPDAWLSGSVLRQPLGLFVLGATGLLMALIVYETVAAWSYKRTLDREREKTAHELENLYEDAPCGYHTLTPDRLVLRINRTELSWLGYSKAEVVGRLNYEDLLLPECRTSFVERFEEFKSGGVVNDFRTTMQRRDGTAMPVTIHATAVRGPSGELLETRATTLDVTERHQLEEELRRQAYTDPLTGVYNRRHFFELGERHFRQALRDNIPVSVCMLDIDHFKYINDKHGHETGDRVLVAVAHYCTESLRPIDLFARLGGEEFALLLPGTSHEQASQVAGRLREALAGMKIAVTHQQILSITVSIGVATSTAQSESLGQLLKQADNQLYTAKQRGRNQVC
jgi:diguanylate cyclase (GGDEF)-like protein/PAS domain S-box-containing protein